MDTIEHKAPSSRSGCYKWFWLILLAIAIVGLIVMVYVTPKGIGLVNDSVGYIGGARNILAGHGYSRTVGDGTTTPITNYPPFFSMVLAGIGLLGIDPLVGSWGLNIVLFSFNIILMGWLAYKVTNSVFGGLLGAVFFLASAPLILTHAFAMSEPLYLFLSFISLIGVNQYLGNQRWYWAATAGLMAGLAFITRYVGVALFLTAAFSLLVFLKDWKKRISGGVIYLAAGLPPALIWIIRNQLVSGNSVNRSLLWHPIEQHKISEGLFNFWGWLLPEWGKLIEHFTGFWGVMFAFLMIFLVVILVIGYHFYRQGKIKQLSVSFIAGWIFTLQGVIYFTVLILSLLFVDASPIFEARILAPFMLSILLLLVVGLTWVMKRVSNVPRLGGALLILFFMLSFAEDDLDVLHDFHQDGQGFASSTWRESETIRAVAELPQVLLFSNRITAIYILADRPAYILPSPTNPADGLPREGYTQDIQMIREKVLKGEAVMVIFDYDGLRDNPEEAGWINDLSADLPLLKHTADGVIFGVPGVGH
jgi:hypothetical protein